MVIWTGRGWLGFLFIVGCLIGGDWLTDGLLGEGYFAGHVWPKLAILAACSGLCWVTGRALNRGLPSKVFDIPGEGAGNVRDPFASAGHTLAFVRLEYAGLIAALLYGFVALEHAGFF